MIYCQYFSITRLYIVVGGHKYNIKEIGLRVNPFQITHTVLLNIFDFYNFFTRWSSQQCEFKTMVKKDFTSITFFW